MLSVQAQAYDASEQSCSSSISKAQTLKEFEISSADVEGSLQVNNRLQARDFNEQVAASNSAPHCVRAHLTSERCRQPSNEKKIRDTSANEEKDGRELGDEQTERRRWARGSRSELAAPVLTTVDMPLPGPAGCNFSYRAHEVAKARLVFVWHTCFLVTTSATSGTACQDLHFLSCSRPDGPHGTRGSTNTPTVSAFSVNCVDTVI